MVLTIFKTILTSWKERALFKDKSNLKLLLRSNSRFFPLQNKNIYKGRKIDFKIREYLDGFDWFNILLTTKLTDRITSGSIQTV